MPRRPLRRPQRPSPRPPSRRGRRAKPRCPPQPAAEAETAEALAAAAGAAPAAEGDGAGGDKTEKEKEADDPIPASEVIEEEDKGANERWMEAGSWWKTVKPPASGGETPIMLAGLLDVS